MAEDFQNKQTSNPAKANDRSSSVADASETNRPVNNPRRWFWGIIVGTFVCQIAIISVFSLSPSLRNRIVEVGVFDWFLVTFRWGTLLAVLSTVAFVSVWGILTGPYRILCSCLLGSVVIAAFVPGFDGLNNHLVTTVMFATLLVIYCALQFLTAWLTRVKLLEINAGVLWQKTKPTFSLKYLGGWSIFFAILLAIVRQMFGSVDEENQGEAGIEALLVFSILFTSSFLLASLTQLSVLGTSPWWLRLLGFVVPIFVITFLEYYALSYVPWGAAPFFVLLCINAIQLGWITLTCGLVRWSGYRLVAR